MKNDSDGKLPFAAAFPPVPWHVRLNTLPVHLGVALWVALAAGAIGYRIFQPSDYQRSMRRAADALARKHYEQAARHARHALPLGHRDEDPQAVMIVAQVEIEQHRPEAAEAWLRRVSPVIPATFMHAQAERAIRMVRLGRVADAEAIWDYYLRRNPGDLDARHAYAQLLLSQGRSWEAQPHLYRLAQHGKLKGDELLPLASTEFLSYVDEDFVATCLRRVPGDPLPLLKTARRSIQQNAIAHAEQILREIVRVRPMQHEAQGRLGQLLVSRPAEYRDWEAALPAQIPPHPEIWVSRGMWARGNQNWAGAARCFWEAIRCQPDHLAAHHQLAACLLKLERPQDAARCAARARELDKINYLLGELTNGYEQIHELAQQLEAMERYTEAAAWCHLTQIAKPDFDWPLEMLRRLHPYLHVGRPTPHSVHRSIAVAIPLADLPLPPPASATPGPAELAPIAAPQPSRVRWQDDASQAGLNFQYYNGADPSGKRVYMFEFSGGGVAAWDYDLDGWPDVYLTQGAPWPLQSQTQYLDQLFRHTANRSYLNVTAAAYLGDPGMGQGATVGDYDQDGFPDLLVTNLGANRLYRNLGDGTFADATEQAGVAGNAWSTGAVLADLNGDRLPDLYVVNYLQGPRAYEQQCYDGQQPVQCGPALFAAADDELYLNLGDGRFRDISGEAGIHVPDGKGLAVVAADIQGSRQFELFVANDTTPNFLFQLRSRLGEPPQYSEQALAAGVACDALGRSQSCMGIAAADLNGDARLDFFVTNFAREANALYVQNEEGYFSDEVAQAGLRDPSFDMMGWGTQALDGELDGWHDLILTNGHINDFRNRGIPYQMPPQYMQNVGRGRFREVPASELGDYFQRSYLGRALARLDWNRDGREDVLITHVDQPVALLTNQTPDPGHYFACQLRGTSSERDAIGAVVMVSTGERTLYAQMTAGDGFYVTNERRLVFGLGPEERVARVQVRWPSGHDQEFHDLPADSGWIFVEGDDTPWRVPSSLEE